MPAWFLGQNQTSVPYAPPGQMPQPQPSQGNGMVQRGGWQFPQTGSGQQLVNSLGLGNFYQPYPTGQAQNMGQNQQLQNATQPGAGGGQQAASQQLLRTLLAQLGQGGGSGNPGFGFWPGNQSLSGMLPK